MSYELSPLVGQLTDLLGRATEIACRMQRDVELLNEHQREISAVLSRLWLYRAEAPLAPAVVAAGPRMLRLPEVKRMVGLATSTIWGKVKTGEFPRPRRLGVRAVAWPSFEIEAWMATRQPSDAGPSDPGKSRPRRLSHR